MTIIKAAAVQISPVLYSREGTVDKVVRKIIELGCQGVQFATFSETLVPYYPYFSYVQRPYETVAEHLRLLEQAVTRQSFAQGPSLSSGLGPGRCSTDFVSVISAIVTPVACRSPAAEPLTIKAYPPNSVGGQNNDTLGTRAMFLPADSPTAQPMPLPRSSIVT